MQAQFVKRAVLALGRAFQREREESALDGLLVAPLSRSALFAGKALGVLAFLFAIAAVVIPLTALLFSLDLDKYGPGLFLLALAALPGVAASGTLFGAMTVRTGARDLLLAVVLFPLIAPTLLAAVAGTRELFGGASIAELGDYFRLMLVFDVVFTAGGLALFGTLVEG
jgi:heme exporter protein B